MESIRIGNDINVAWKVYTRDGVKYPLDDKTLRIWLLSGPYKKEITGYTLQDRNELDFSIDAKEITRYGIYRLVLVVKDAESEIEDASFDIDYVFQIVSRYYPDTGDIIDGTAELGPVTILKDITGYGRDGESAYEIAVRNGFVGTEQEWLESLKATIPLYGTKGDHTDGTMTQKAISDLFDSLELANAVVNFTASPAVVPSGTATTVVLSLDVTGLGSAGATLLEILDSSSTVIASGAGVGFSTQVSLSAAASYTARVTHGSAVRTVPLSVQAVGPIYYGSGTDASDFGSNKVAHPTPKTSVAGTYNVTVRNSGDYVFFQIPSTMTINNVTLGGFGFPMTLQSTSGGYKLYRSDNTYIPGTLTLAVS